jgi:hypothetical protein
MLVPAVRALPMSWWAAIAIVLLSMAADIRGRTRRNEEGEEGDPMNPYRYQHEKIGNAVGALMSLTMTVERRMRGAMSEFLGAYHDSDARAGSPSYYEDILAIAGDVRDERWTTKLSSEQRDRLSTAFLTLDRVISHEFYRVEARSAPASADP